MMKTDIVPEFKLIQKSKVKKNNNFLNLFHLSEDTKHENTSIKIGDLVSIRPSKKHSNTLPGKIVKINNKTCRVLLLWKPRNSSFDVFFTFYIPDENGDLIGYGKNDMSAKAKIVEEKEAQNLNQKNIDYIQARSIDL